MSQSHRASLLEAVTNVVVGYGLAVGAQLAVFPVFGLVPTLPDSLRIAALFTGLSLARGYLLRRLFEGFTRRASRCPANPSN